MPNFRARELTSDEGTNDVPLRHWHSSMWWQVVIIFATVGLLAALSPSYGLATSVMIYGIAAVGANLLLGYTGLLSFGQGIFFGVGAYASGLVMVHLDVQAPIALLVAAVTGMVTALLVGAVSIMRRGVYFVMLTFAFSAMFGYGVFLFKDITGGENGLRGFPQITVGSFGTVWWSLKSDLDVFIFTAFAFVIVYLALVQVVRSPFGATLIAIRENESRAAAIGYNTFSFKLQSFGISGFVTGLAGGLYAIYLGSVPGSALQLDLSTMILIMTILGGTGSLYGSVLGAAAVLIMSDYLSVVWDRWQMLLALALLAVVMFARGGIWGGIEVVAEWSRRWFRHARLAQGPRRWRG